MGTWPIDRLEAHVRSHVEQDDELKLVLAELGYRRTRRAVDLKDLVKRLIGTDQLARRPLVRTLFGEE